MRKRNQMKKGIAALLSGVLAFGMTAGIVPAIPGNPKQVEAATSKPSVTAYATKTQLKDYQTFGTDTNGKPNNKIGVLAFGKNQDGKPQKWYILGNDNRIASDNAFIFAVTPVIDRQTFTNTTEENRTLQDSWGEYNSSKKQATVSRNHYGASDIRAKLQSIAKDKNRFSVAEQNLMNATTIETSGYIGGNTTEYKYKTTDKLYAPHYTNGKTIEIGTWSTRSLLLTTYLKDSTKQEGSSWVWTRVANPGYENDQRVYAVDGYGNVSTTFSINDSAKAFTYPASNLNLTDVLFASSAEAATSGTTVSDEIAQGKAMTLRLNGDGKDIGTVTCNADAGQINAKKGNTTGNVALVVQGNDGTKDWYYSKQISGIDNVIVNASDIAAESNTPSDIDLTNCKIWLEVTEDSVAYAVEATTTTDVVKTNISSVEVTGIDTPVSNTALDTSAVCATQGVSTTAPAVTWTPGDVKAGYNTSYTASVTLEASANYEFTDPVIVTINGNNASVTKNEDGTLTVTYTFPATAKDKLTSITAPGAVTVANGTAYKDMNLPTQVNIVTEGNTVDKADVIWDRASGNYDPSVLTEQVVTLNGTVTCPENIDANGVALTTSITITVSAAGIVGAPTPSVESGTYTENQKVALKSSTEGATIYYTTNGAEPGRTTGTRYTDPITVGGMEGQSITTTLKAIAVKGGMQDSEVKTFTYTINIPKPIVKHTITATAGANGSISPSGKVEVVEGADQAFSITANEGYEIESLKVDGAAVSTATSYTFTNVRAAHTIEATFKQKITVEKPSIGKQPQNVSVKAGEQATFTVAATGTDLKYQWQIDRNDGKGFADIAGADRASYTTSAVDKNCNGYKYQCVISNSAGSVTTNAATLTVTEDVTPPSVTKHIITATAGANGSISPSGAVEVTEGADQTFTITANDGYEIASLKVDGTAVAAKTSYTFTNVTKAHTIEATFKQKITVEKPSITQQPQNVFVKIGERATFTVAATGTDLVYQWQMDMKDAKGFVDIGGATEPSYTTSTVDMDYDGFTYRCIIANKAGSVTSNVVTLTVGEDVTPPSVTKHIITATAGANGSISPSGAVEVTEGADQTFTITANDGYEIASLKVDGKTVNTAASYTFKNVTAAHTIEVTFKQKATPVQPTVKKPGISKQPQNVSVKAGEQATFTVKATGTDLTYQWQINRNNGKGFVDITGADKASYTTGVADMLCNGYKYQCVISNSAGSVTTNAATLTVTESTTPSPDPVSYKILDGANSSWPENTDGSLTIRGNGEMEKFQNVKVDGKIIDKKNYTVTKGSTIITLKADYLKTLATGDHTFEIVWTDGSATTKFAVAKNKSGDNNKNNNNNNKKNNSNNAKNNQTTQNNPTDTKKKEQSVTAPKTGDTSDMTLWTTLLIVSFAGAAGIVVRRNNKTCK